MVLYTFFRNCAPFVQVNDEMFDVDKLFLIIDEWLR